MKLELEFDAAGHNTKEVRPMDGKKYPGTVGEEQPRDPNQRMKWKCDAPYTYFEPEPKKQHPNFLLWFLPQFIQHVGEVMVGVSLCRFIEFYADRIPELIHLIIPK